MTANAPHTIKFAPALSQKELEKALKEATDPAVLKTLHKMRARIDVVCDFDDLKSLAEMFKNFLLSHAQANRPYLNQ